MNPLTDARMDAEQEVLDASSRLELERALAHLIAAARAEGVGRAMEARAAFLSGEGTLTVAEVGAWARELAPDRDPHPSLLPDDEPLMVSVRHPEGGPR